MKNLPNDSIFLRGHKDVNTRRRRMNGGAVRDAVRDAVMPELTVQIFDGSSEINAHVRSNLCHLIC